MTREPLNVDKEAIKQLAISGVPYNTICQTFGIAKGTLLSWVHRGGWPVPKRTEKIAKLAGDQRGYAIEVQSQGAIAASSMAASLTAGQQLAQNGERGSLLASELLLALLEGATVAKLKPLAHVSDVSTALSAVRKAAGMDRTEGVNCSVNLAMFSQNEVEWVASASAGE